MAKRVNLDAMIPREDFAIQAEDNALDLLPAFPITSLQPDAPILKLLRKPDFQRETNHWVPDQIVTFIASFLDNEVIPSLIFWKSPTYIFVIDGGHRLSALRAWMEDDYGDGAHSAAFYKADISDEQKKIAKRTRELIDKRIGSFVSLKSYVDSKTSDERSIRAKRLFTRALALQWVQGSADVAETSFFKINSQGTPLDETETSLIKNRRKPIAISARAILRSGSGHKYWSAFTEDAKREIEKRAAEFHTLLFEPEAESPIKTLDVPLGGSVSPVDALSLLIEFLALAGNREQQYRSIEAYKDDGDGTGTLGVLKNALQVLARITGNGGSSLGLHPAIYFYNEKGKYSRFLFLGMTTLICEKLRDNDSGWFKKFTKARKHIESFLIEHKPTLGLVLQNMGKSQRVPKMRDLFAFLASRPDGGIGLEEALGHIGVTGRILELSTKQTTPHISDDTKSLLFIQDALSKTLDCPICGGRLDPKKSVSYDHIERKADGGSGGPENVQLVHPYCNTGYKESLGC